MQHGAGVLVIRQDGAILFQLRDNKPEIAYPNYWSVPMGEVNEGEDYKIAAMRELTEETDYVPGEVEELINIEIDSDEGRRIAQHLYWTMYDGKQTINCNEGQEMRFLHLGELLKEKYQPGQDELFRLAVGKARERGLLKQN